jgi:hypothetical protein
VNQNNIDKTDPNRYAGLNGTVGVNCVRDTMYIGYTGAQAESFMANQHLNNHRALIAQRFGNRSTDAQTLAAFPPSGQTSNASGSTLTALVKCMVQDWITEFTNWNPIQNKLAGIGIANEWGGLVSSPVSNAIFQGVYQAVFGNISGIAGNVITVDTVAAANPYALSKMAYLLGSGAANQMVNITGTSGTSGSYTVTVDVPLGTFGAGGTLNGGAIGALRAAGYLCPIMIDASGQGNNVTQLITLCNTLLASDPQSNLIFDYHVYSGGGTLAQFTTTLANIANTGCCFLVGEFGYLNDSNGTQMTTQQIITACEAAGVGYCAWAMDNSDLGSPPLGSDDNTWCMNYTTPDAIPQLPSNKTVLGKAALLSPTYGMLTLGEPATSL